MDVGPEHDDELKKPEGDQVRAESESFQTCLDALSTRVDPPAEDVGESDEPSRAPDAESDVAPISREAATDIREKEKGGDGSADLAAKAKAAPPYQATVDDGGLAERREGDGAAAAALTPAEEALAGQDADSPVAVPEASVAASAAQEGRQARAKARAAERAQRAASTPKRSKAKTRAAVKRQSWELSAEEEAEIFPLTAAIEKSSSQDPTPEFKLAALLDGWTFVHAPRPEQTHLDTKKRKGKKAPIGAGSDEAPAAAEMGAAPPGQYTSFMLPRHFAPLGIWLRSASVTGFMLPESWPEMRKYCSRPAPPYRRIRQNLYSDPGLKGIVPAAECPQCDCEDDDGSDAERFQSYGYDDPFEDFDSDSSDDGDDDGRKKKKKRKKQKSAAAAAMAAMSAPVVGRGCGEECLNRQLYMECLPGCCPSLKPGETHCANTVLQRRAFPPTEVFRTHDGRGWGLRLADKRGAAPGTILHEYMGEVIDIAECRERLEQLGSDGRRGDFYLAGLTAELVLDAGPMGSEARFANHSCEPNCQLQKWSVQGETRVVLVALSDLSYGEELTYNYRAETMGGLVDRQPCACGAERCARFIGGSYEAPEGEQDDRGKGGGGIGNGRSGGRSSSRGRSTRARGSGGGGGSRAQPRQRPAPRTPLSAAIRSSSEDAWEAWLAAGQKALGLPRPRMTVVRHLIDKGLLLGVGAAKKAAEENAEVGVAGAASPAAKSAKSPRRKSGKLKASAEIAAADAPRGGGATGVLESYEMVGLLELQASGDAWLAERAKLLGETKVATAVRRKRALAFQSAKEAIGGAAAAGGAAAEADDGVCSGGSSASGEGKAAAPAVAAAVAAGSETDTAEGRALADISIERLEALLKSAPVGIQMDEVLEVERLLKRVGAAVQSVTAIVAIADAHGLVAPSGAKVEADAANAAAAASDDGVGDAAAAKLEPAEAQAAPAAASVVGAPNGIHGSSTVAPSAAVAAAAETAASKATLPKASLLQVLKMMKEVRALAPIIIPAAEHVAAMMYAVEQWACETCQALQLRLLEEREAAAAAEAALAGGEPAKPRAGEASLQPTRVGAAAVQQWMRVSGASFGMDCRALVTLELRLDDRAAAAAAAAEGAVCKESGGTASRDRATAALTKEEPSASAAGGRRHSGRRYSGASQSGMEDDEEDGPAMARRKKPEMRVLSRGKKAQRKLKIEGLEEQKGGGSSEGNEGEEEGEEGGSDGGNEGGGMNGGRNAPKRAKKIPRSGSAVSNGRGGAAAAAAVSVTSCCMCEGTLAAAPTHSLAQCQRCLRGFHPLCVCAKVSLGGRGFDFATFCCPGCHHSSGRPSPLATGPPPGFYPQRGQLPSLVELEGLIAAAKALPIYLEGTGAVKRLAATLGRAMRWRQEAEDALVVAAACEDGGRAAAAAAAESIATQQWHRTSEREQQREEQALPERLVLPLLRPPAAASGICEPAGAGNGAAGAAKADVSQEKASNSLPSCVNSKEVPEDGREGVSLGASLVVRPRGEDAGAAAVAAGQAVGQADGGGGNMNSASIEEDGDDDAISWLRTLAQQETPRGASCKGSDAKAEPLVAGAAAALLMVAHGAAAPALMLAGPAKLAAVVPPAAAAAGAPAVKDWPFEARIVERLGQLVRRGAGFDLIDLKETIQKLRAALWRLVAAAACHNAQGTERLAETVIANRGKDTLAAAPAVNGGNGSGATIFAPLRPPSFDLLEAVLAEGRELSLQAAPAFLALAAAFKDAKVAMVAAEITPFSDARSLLPALQKMSSFVDVEAEWGWVRARASDFAYCRFQHQWAAAGGNSSNGGAAPDAYCICRGQDDGSFMLQCDACEEWFHGLCIGLPNKRAYEVARQKKRARLLEALAPKESSSSSDEGSSVKERGKGGKQLVAVPASLSGQRGGEEKPQPPAEKEVQPLPQPPPRQLQHGKEQNEKQEERHCGSQQQQPQHPQQQLPPQTQPEQNGRAALDSLPQPSLAMLLAANGGAKLELPHHQEAAGQLGPAPEAGLTAGDGAPAAAGNGSAVANGLTGAYSPDPASEAIDSFADDSIRSGRSGGKGKGRAYVKRESKTRERRATRPSCRLFADGAEESDDDSFNAASEQLSRGAGKRAREEGAAISSLPLPDTFACPACCELRPDVHGRYLSDWGSACIVAGSREAAAVLQATTPTTPGPLLLVGLLAQPPVQVQMPCLQQAAAQLPPTTAGGFAAGAWQNHPHNAPVMGQAIPTSPVDVSCGGGGRDHGGDSSGSCARGNGVAHVAPDAPATACAPAHPQSYVSYPSSGTPVPVQQLGPRFGAVAPGAADACGLPTSVTAVPPPLAPEPAHWAATLAAGICVWPQQGAVVPVPVPLNPAAAAAAPSVLAGAGTGGVPAVPAKVMAVPRGIGPQSTLRERSSGAAPIVRCCRGASDAFTVGVGMSEPE